MKTYYVLKGELSFGFGGFFQKAFLTMDQAQEAMQEAKKRYRNITSIEIVETAAKSKKEAENANKKSMYTGIFAGADNVSV